MKSNATVEAPVRHVRDVLLQGMKKAHLSAQAEDRQQEMFNLRYENTRLLYSVARLIGGSEKEQREAIDDMIALCSDPIMARRVVRVLDGAGEDLRKSLSNLYDRAMRACSPG